MQSFIKKYHAEFLGALICLTLGMLSGYAVKAGGGAWYLELKKPSFNPPGYVFGPVWSVLYIMIGIALGKIWKNTIHLVAFCMQFFFNLLWTPLFFYFHRIDLALYDICLLWLSLIALFWITRKIRSVPILLLPYMLWVSFALVLNLNLYLLN